MKQTKHFFLTAVMLLSSLAASAHDFEVGGIYYSRASELTGVSDYKYIYCPEPGQLHSLYEAAGRPSNLKVGGYISGKDFEDLYYWRFEDGSMTYDIKNLDLSEATIMEYTSSRHNAFSTKANQLVWNFIKSSYCPYVHLSTLVLPDNCEYFYTENFYKDYAYDDEYQLIDHIYTNCETPFGFVYGDSGSGSIGILHTPEGSKPAWQEQLRNGHNSVADNAVNTCMVADTPEKIMNERFSLTAEEIANVDILTINCDVNARDFATLNKMPQLCKLTINGKILAYTGLYGPINGVYTSYPANEVPERAFADNKTLQYIKLDKCNNYGNCCFQNATNLRYVEKWFNEMADHTSVIGDYAFDGCVNLVCLENAPWHYDIGHSSIGDFAFRNTQLKTIELSSYTVEYSWDEYTYDDLYRKFSRIGKNPFFGVRSKHGINYGYSCFRNDDGGGDNKGAFTYNWGCYSDSKYPGQHEILLENKLCAYAYTPRFSGTRASEYAMSSNITEVADWAISDVYMHGLTISENLEKIGEAFLYKCTDLAYIKGCSSEFTTVDSVLYTSDKSTIIKYPAAHPRTEFHITEEVKNIDAWAFENIKNLKTLYIHSVNPLELSDNVFEDVDLSLLTLYVPAESLGLYKTADVWKDFGEILPINSYVASGTCGDNLTWRLTEEGELIIEGTGEMYDYTHNYGTQAPWEEYRSSIKEVTIFEGVTSISGQAFEYCSNLTVITIPGSVTSIGYRAFSSCSSLTAITIAEGNTVYDSRGGCNAIIETSSNTLITGCSATVIPEGVTNIERYAFCGCSNLAAINIPGGVTSIGSNAFYSCTSLTTITIPSSVMSIGYMAFFGCSSLASVNSLENVTHIGERAFCQCNLTRITIPAGMTSIEKGAFANNPNLIEIVVEQGNAYYDSRNNCNAIIETSKGLLVAGCSSTVIPEGVSTIGYCAFSHCSNLTAITIPESVTCIGDFAFSDCSSLAEITCEAVNPPRVGEDYPTSPFMGVSRSTPIYVPAGSVEAYQSADGWSEFTNIQAIPSTDIASGTCGDNLTWRLTEEYELIIEGIGEMSDGSPWYEYCTSIQAVTLSEGVTSIGRNAFEDCSNLTTITIPKGVMSIGDYAFLRCSNLSIVTISEGVSSIGNFVFSLCSSLSSITLPKSVTSVGSGLFSYCNSLTSITVDEENTVYDSRENAIIETNSNTLVAGCSTTIIHETIKSIAGYAFCGFEFVSITIPQGVTCIRDYAFQYCSNLNSVVVDENNIVYDSRNSCNAVIETNSNTLVVGCSTTVIPESVSAIGINAFCGCGSLTSITIPENVTSIGDWAFANCFNLASITCEATMPPTIADLSTFYGVDRSIPVYVPATSVADYNSFRYWKEFTSIIGMEATGIDNLELINQNSELIYDLHGRRITDTEGLKGIYIVGGKKTVIK